MINDRILFTKYRKQSLWHLFRLLQSQIITSETFIILDSFLGVINKYDTDMSPIDENCECPVCRRYSRAYIRHLLKAGEILGARLMVLHNLWFYNNLMEEIRSALDENRFSKFKREKEEILGRRI